MAPATTIASITTTPTMGEHTHPLQLSAWIPALIFAVISCSASLGQLWFAWAADKRSAASAPSLPLAAPQTAVPAAPLPPSTVYATALLAAAAALNRDAAAFNGAAAASPSAAEVALLSAAAVSATTAAHSALSVVLSAVPLVSPATPIAPDAPPCISPAAITPPNLTPADPLPHAPDTTPAPLTSPPILNRDFESQM